MKIYSDWQYNQFWRCYWEQDSNKTLYDQIFTIDDYEQPIQLSYADIAHDIMGCVERVKCTSIDPSTEETMELYKYMKLFLKDVDHEYSV